AFLVNFGIGHGPGQVDHLEGKARGRCGGVGEDRDGARGDVLSHPSTKLWIEAGFLAEGKGRSDLDSRGAKFERLRQLLRPGRSPREPEGNAQGRELREVHHVAIAVERL